MKIIDISLPLNEQTPIYPNNAPLVVNIHRAMPEYSTQLSKITLGSHTGTHIDAPAHCIQGASTLDKIPLERFIGPCRVFDFSGETSPCVTKEMLQSTIIKIDNAVRECEGKPHPIIPGRQAWRTL